MCTEKCLMAVVVHMSAPNLSELPETETETDTLLANLCLVGKLGAGAGEGECYAPEGQPAVHTKQEKN